MRLLKLLTVLLALSSVIALVLASRATSRPLTTISAVQPQMNFAYVRIQGEVPAHPTLSEKDGFLSFRVLDASGELRVSAYRAVVEQLLAQRRIPMPGDRVTAEGTLRVRDDEPSLILNTPDALTIETLDAVPVQLAAMDAMRLGERAQVVGQVRKVRDVNDALRIITLRDGNATADVLLPLDLSTFGVVPQLEAGEWISATGGVGEYRGSKQLLPSSATAIAPINRLSNDHVRPINALSKDLRGQWVQVEGQVSDLQPFSQGMRVELRDDSNATITVVMFDSVWQTLSFSTTLSVDDPLSVVGELTEYRGQLEILPELPVDVSRK